MSRVFVGISLALFFLYAYFMVQGILPLASIDSFIHASSIKEMHDSGLFGETRWNMPGYLLHPPILLPIFWVLSLIPADFRLIYVLFQTLAVIISYAVHRKLGKGQLFFNFFMNPVVFYTLMVFSRINEFFALNFLLIAIYLKKYKKTSFVLFLASILAQPTVLLVYSLILLETNKNLIKRVIAAYTVASPYLFYLFISQSNLAMARARYFFTASPALVLGCFAFIFGFLIYQKKQFSSQLAWYSLLTLSVLNFLVAFSDFFSHLIPIVSQIFPITIVLAFIFLDSAKFDRLKKLMFVMGFAWVFIISAAANIQNNSDITNLVSGYNGTFCVERIEGLRTHIFYKTYLSTVLNKTIADNPVFEFTKGDLWALMDLKSCAEIPKECDYVVTDNYERFGDCLIRQSGDLFLLGHRG